MFDIAWSELLLIAILALVFIGPKELPHVLHALGKVMAKLRRSADDFRRQFEDSIREAGYEDLNKNLQDFRQLNPANQLRDSIDRALNQEYSRSGPVLYSEADPEGISKSANIPPESGASANSQTTGEGIAPNSHPENIAMSGVGAQDAAISVTPNAATEPKVSQASQAPNTGSSSTQDKSEHAVPVA